MLGSEKVWGTGLVRKGALGRHGFEPCLHHLMTPGSWASAFNSLSLNLLSSHFLHLRALGRRNNRIMYEKQLRPWRKGCGRALLDAKAALMKLCPQGRVNVHKTDGRCSMAICWMDEQMHEPILNVKVNDSQTLAMGSWQ